MLQVQDYYKQRSFTCLSTILTKITPDMRLLESYMSEF